MLKRLRRRFVLVTMLLVAVILASILTLNVVSVYQSQYLGLQIRLGEVLSRPGSTQVTTELRPIISMAGLIGLGQDTEQNAANATLVTYDIVSGRISFSDSFDPSPDMTEASLRAATYRIIERNPFLLEDGSKAEAAGMLSDLGLAYRAITTQKSNTGISIPDNRSYEARIAFASTSPMTALVLQQIGVTIVLFAVAILAFLIISLILTHFALRPVSDAWVRQRRFIADASHELKTPLTVILANSNILRSHRDMPIASQLQWIDSTHYEAQRMDTLVRDLLLLARTDAEEHENKALEKKLKKRGDRAALAAESPRIDLSSLVNRALLQFDAVFFERGISLRSEIGKGVHVAGNEEQIDRLMSILLDNASKYCAPKGRISVSLECAKDFKSMPQGQAGKETDASKTKKEARHLKVPRGMRVANLVVVNDGEPISPERLPYLFERFYRGDEAHSEQIEGFGLGLSLAKNIVDAHGGLIRVSSTVEDGTAFTVSLPALEADS